MFTFDYKYRVRYADVDQMGYMYYGNYAKLYEIGRVEALRHLGVSYKEMEESGVMMPVYDNYSRFIQPAKFDELLTIRVMVEEMPKMRFIVKYEILDEALKKIHTGASTLVFINMTTNRLTLCPDAITAVFQPFLTDKS
ncbi:MAG: acyl-CoA thioesterase [Spirosomaceae bacterium]|nr:acyl-CoA thioesterase [Spirosomataceae bacterium]